VCTRPLAASVVCAPEGNDRTRALAEELLTYEVRVSESANLQAGAFKTGTHDDMATALGLACLYDPSGQQVRYFHAPL